MSNLLTMRVEGSVLSAVNIDVATATLIVFLAASDNGHWPFEWSGPSVPNGVIMNRMTED